MNLNATANSSLDFQKKTYTRVPYSHKFWRGENLTQLAQNGKNRQIKSAPFFIYFFLAAPI